MWWVLDGKLASPPPETYVDPRYNDIGCVASVATGLLCSAVRLCNDSTERLRNDGKLSLLCCRYIDILF